MNVHSPGNSPCDGATAPANSAPHDDAMSRAKVKQGTTRFLLNHDMAGYMWRSAGYVPREPMCSRFIEGWQKLDFNSF